MIRRGSRPTRGTFPARRWGRVVRAIPREGELPKVIEQRVAGGTRCVERLQRRAVVRGEPLHERDRSPRLGDADHLRRGLAMVGREHRPEDRQRGRERLVGGGKRFGVTLAEVDTHLLGRRALAAAVEEGGNVALPVPVATSRTLESVPSDRASQVTPTSDRACSWLATGIRAEEPGLTGCCEAGPPGSIADSPACDRLLTFRAPGRHRPSQRRRRPPLR